MSRPLLARKDTKADEDRQRREVRARDGNVCRFEVLKDGVTGSGYIARGWFECGKKSATDTAHIYRRRECGKARWHVDVALLACRDCHTAYDNGLGGVRVPPDREARAYETICENSKVPPPRQSPEGNRL